LSASKYLLAFLEYHGMTEVVPFGDLESADTCPVAGVALSRGHHPLFSQGLFACVRRGQIRFRTARPGLPRRATNLSKKAAAI
jgi:hypothetical protein